MKFITCSKKVRDMASKILKYQNVISEMIYADISDELFRKGEIIIPETLLYHEISKYMAKEDPGVTIYSLVCEDNHIDMAVAINRKWGGFGFDVRLSIRDVEVSKNRQVISFHAEFRKVAYNNVVERLSGKMTGVTILKRIVGMIIRTIIDHIFKLNDSLSNYTDFIIFSPKDRYNTWSYSQIHGSETLPRFEGIETGCPVAGATTSVRSETLPRFEGIETFFRRQERRLCQPCHFPGKSAGAVYCKLFYHCSSL